MKVKWEYYKNMAGSCISKNRAAREKLRVDLKSPTLN